MNRLWVRFSLVIVGVAFFITLSPFLGRILLFSFTGPSAFIELRQALPEVAESLPEGTMERLREAAVADALASIAALIIVGAAAALVVGVWLSRSLTAPLQQLETAARAIEVRDFSQRVAGRGSRELVAVASAFNEMAEQLQQAETLRRNLLADVAHELRHPLHVLQGNLRAILDGVYPLSKEEIARLVDQTHHLTTLVNDLHVLAQAEAHQLPLHKQAADMADLLKETAAGFKPLAAGRSISLQVELLGALPVIEVDAARIRQVVHNLLDNALRHTPDGGAITVQLERVADSLQVTVRDSGTGLAPEHLAHVFDRFYRADSGRSRDRGGTGLGLAIVKAIVETHGGRVAVTSAGVGQGSEFAFWLPL
ncbi:MAG: ATP-binding protein [Chloroflexi bacterium]|nr:ATP-binding protein [Chloroflexota bacterium]MCI0579584.1 ATP-binding protein [Chloroflexota bacterium]MCI0644339.1 ATP-binding protein [Chloroflexota bacterium]MCI0725142.1 ATP-binding protein [Chloroflexota bacterium]